MDGIKHLPAFLLMNVVAIPRLPERPVRPILWTETQLYFYIPVFVFLEHCTPFDFHSTTDY